MKVTNVDELMLRLEKVRAAQKSSQNSLKSK